ncbi:MAG: SNF2-related protein [Nannocystaceae bacterium]
MNIESLLPLCEEDVLQKLVSKKAFPAGRELAQKNSVSDLVVDERGVRGKVRGSRPTPYSTSLTVAGPRKNPHLEGSCSCPTFTDGWEKVCQHAVAVALAFQRQYKTGGELATTENPWVAKLAKKTDSTRRYQVEARQGAWAVKVFASGVALEATRRRVARDSLHPADRFIQGFLDQEIDEDEDGSHILEDAALAGLLYFAREATVSIKGTGKLKFVAEPLVLRVKSEARSKDAKIELHAYLEHVPSERRFEIDDGRIIAGAPTWFLWPSSAEIYQVLDTPPWVLASISQQPRILMDGSVGAQQMDLLSDQLQAVGVPRQDLFALASDSREIEKTTVSIEGDSERIKVRLLVKYGNVSLAVAGSDPESARHTLKVDGGTIAFYRDIASEAQARSVLHNLKLRWKELDDAFVAVGDDAIEFMIAGIPLLPDEWEKRIPKLPKIRSKSPSPSISVRNRGGSVLDVEALVAVEGENDLISFRDLLRWLHEGRRWVTLADGSVAKLDPKILQPIADAAGDLLFDKTGAAEVSTLELGTLSRLMGAVPTATVAKDVKRLMSNMTGSRASRAPRKAKTLTAKLREYQRSGYAWLWQLHENNMTGILADDMGLGKTVQALALLTRAKEIEGPVPSLIVCPTSVLSVWRQEVKKWAPSLSVLTWHGSDRGENRRLLKKVDIVVTTYAVLRRDIEDLAKIRFRYAIIDEAQYIKNWNTSTAKSTKQLNAEHRLALSGTPVENHLVDLWAIFDFLAPGFLGKLTDFQKSYVRPIEDGNVNVLESLRARVRPFIMRRRKEDVASELPPKTEQLIYVQFGRTQLGLYNRILKAARSEIQGRIDDMGIEKSQMTILAALTRLRQVCTDPRLLGLPEGTTVPPSAKLEAFKEIITECVGSGRKTLVFSQFVEMQKLIGAALKELEVDYLWLHGGTRNREELVEQFQQKSGPPVFLISLKAGGSGITLTEADTVIHYDPWWNPAVEDQATDRAHRIGQDKPVMVYRLVVESTVEQKMVELGDQKRKVAESALGRDTKVGKKLTMLDVERLLESPAAAPSWEEV